MTDIANPAAHEFAVKTLDVTKEYTMGRETVHALRGVDLTIERGSMVAIMGPSGCGKTTLLNCLSGIDDVTEGTVHIEGTDLAELDDNSKTSYRARRMGFIFQFYNLLPVLSAVENVELPLLVSGIRLGVFSFYETVQFLLCLSQVAFVLADSTQRVAHDFVVETVHVHHDQCFCPVECFADAGRFS